MKSDITLPVCLQESLDEFYPFPQNARIKEFKKLNANFFVILAHQSNGMPYWMLMLFYRKKGKSFSRFSLAEKSYHKIYLQDVTMKTLKSNFQISVCIKKGCIDERELIEKTMIEIFSIPKNLY